MPDALPLAASLGDPLPPRFPAQTQTPRLLHFDVLIFLLAVLL